MLIKTINAGYMSFPDGKVDITDPCYDDDTWCRMSQVSIKPGDYRLRVYQGAGLTPDEIKEKTEHYNNDLKDDDFYKTHYPTLQSYLDDEIDDVKNRCWIIEMQLKGRAFQFDSPKWKEIGEIGVDAGLAGFFPNKPNFKDNEWSALCDWMFSDKKNKSKNYYIKKDLGFWCNSGYGDGAYGVYAIKENDEIIALKITF